MAYGTFTDVIRLRVLRCTDYSELSGWAQCDHMIPYKGKRRQEGQTGEVMMAYRTGVSGVKMLGCWP